MLLRLQKCLRERSSMLPYTQTAFIVKRSLRCVFREVMPWTLDIFFLNHVHFLSHPRVVFSFPPTYIFFLTHMYFLSHSRAFSFSPTCSIFFLTLVYFISHPRVVFSFSPTCSTFFLTLVYFLSHPRVFI